VYNQAVSLITNKKAGLNYEILEKYSAGIELFGFEVKSLRKGWGALDGGHVTVRGGEAFIVGITIPPYQLNNTPKDYEPTRNRRLLLNHKEIQYLSDIESKKGLTIVPLSVYNKDGILKVDIGVVRGKKKYDKREDMKKRDALRQAEREVSR
jgi:SsrA-binding protein